MRASGNFGDDTAVFSKNIYLRNDDVTKNMSTVFDDGDSGFVAGSFDAEDYHGVIISNKMNYMV